MDWSREELGSLIRAIVTEVTAGIEKRRDEQAIRDREPNAPETPRVKTKEVMLGDIVIGDAGVRFGKIGEYWGSLSPGAARELAFAILGRWRGAPGEDVLIFWRGSVSDLVTDLAGALDPQKFEELAGSVSNLWRQRESEKS